MHSWKSIVVGIVGLCLGGCADSNAPSAGTGIAGEAKAPAPAVRRIEPGPNAQKEAQTALIKARPGEIVEFGAGRFDFTSTLSLDGSDVTVRGQGPDKTILSFKNQGTGTGGEGLLITSKADVEIRDLAVEDAKGDAVKARGTNRITLRNLRTEWTDGPKESNGGYGVYPVLCTDVLIENCYARGASDSGIYVGQSENIIVRRNRARQNVAGIEIENSVKADVYENELTENTGGILVFSLPDLEKKESRACRVFNNQVVANNHENFAPKGNIVASVSPGTGLMVMAGDDVEIFDNTIERNQTTGILIISYLLTGRPVKDDRYDPFCERITIRDNRFVDNGKQPAGTLAQMFGAALGATMPDVLYDGITSEKPTAGGSAPDDQPSIMINNKGASFASLGGDPQNPKVSRDAKAHQGSRPPLPAVEIEGLQ